ncbi:DUF305 domain-containing protein [Candidatus Dojkabacteria bacterium]|uniref:DUF305 domain-containing protein n=1 Tax=Candidatus Dojkabacteria bacterium TaxID=2099670 RepID=A0A5C7JCP2_9BACT|nr:MAG: DUF305 domain-containing protein [Candidatus Dojkabacteria bacterium]
MNLSKKSVAAGGAIALIAGLSGLMIGQMQTPEYRLTMYEKNMTELGRADQLFDLRYLNAMITHHRGAVLLAEQAAKSQRAEIRDLAAAIQTGEPKLIAELYQWKKDWYGDTRTVRDPWVAELGEVNDTFDLRFLNALIAHHEAGVLMTQETRLKSSRAAVLDNADTVEAFLQTSGAELREWRSAWYAQ